MMPVRFESPEWLWLIALAVPAAWVALRWFSTMSPVRRASAWAARAALLVVLGALLAGASAVRQTERIAVVALVDVSDSVLGRAMPVPLTAPQGGATDLSAPPAAAVLDAARAALRRVATERGPDDLLGIVAFGAAPRAVAAPTRGLELTERPWAAPSGETDLAAAIELGAALIPADATGRLVLISDGGQTRGDALRAADALSSALPIDVVPIDLAERADVAVERVDVPTTAAGESVVTARVTLSASAPAEGALVLLYDGHPVDLDPAGTSSRLPLRLEPGTRTVLAPVRLVPGRVHRFRAVWEPARAGADDLLADNNQAESFTFTPGRGSVLIVDGSRDFSTDHALERALRGAGLNVERVAPPAAPEDPIAWQRHDLVILQNVAADELSEPAQHSLAAHVVRFGAGLVMVGGDKSFGAGGWKGSAIEPLLPVRLDVPERLVMQRVAVVIVLDSSGSMQRSVLGSSRTQQAIANEAAARAVESMPAHDLVGVIRFSNSAEQIVPLSPNTDPAATASRIRGILPNGGTNLRPALELARRRLTEADADIRHVIVLSDGRSQQADALPGIAREMADDSIQVTCIAVGDEADRDNLAAIAREGGGRFFAVIDPNTLPRIFLAAVRVVRSPLIREGRFAPVRSAEGSVLTEGLGELAALRGFVLTERRDEPSVLTALSTEAGEPLLASWPAGLGQVAAFTSDADAWAREWRQTELFDRFWTQAARRMARPPGRRWAQLDADIADGRLRLRLDAAGDDGRPLDSLLVPITVYGPSGHEIETMMTQTGPGLYEAEVEAREPGSYVVAATPSRGATALTPVIAGAVAPRGAESRAARTDHALLRELAERTGGRVLALGEAGPGVLSASVLFDRASIEPRIAPRPIWQPLIALAMALLLLDVATRRIAWDRWFSRRFGADLHRAAADAVADRSARAAEALGALRTRAPRAAEVSAAALTRDDAAALARALEARRQRDRIDEARQRLAAQRQPDRPRSAGTDAPTDKPVGEGASLLDAKRRARARYQSDDATGVEREDNQR